MTLAAGVAHRVVHKFIGTNPTYIFMIVILPKIAFPDLVPILHDVILTVLTYSESQHSSVNNEQHYY